MPPVVRATSLCVALALLVAAAVTGCKRQKLDPAGAARLFFEQVSRGETAEAYRSTAFNFQSQQTEKSFVATTRELELIGAKVAELAVKESDPREALLQASLTTPKGQEIAFSVSMLHETGKWRVLALRSPRNPKTGVSENRFSLVGKPPTFSDAPNRPLPNDAEQRRLVRSAMLNFNDSIKAKDFSSFYQYVSQAWRAQLTERKLQNAFQSFIDQRVNLSGVADVEPVFDGPPQVTTDGLMHLAGEYPTKPFKVRFAFKYIYELPEWKLFGLDIYLLKAEPVPAASPAPATPAPASNPAPEGAAVPSAPAP